MKQEPGVEQGKKKIVVVDDHPITRVGVRSILETENDIAVVGEAKDGLEAIEKTKSLEPDIVVMDISMPQLSGIDATKKILDKHADVKIIALSIHSGNRFVQEMLDAGASGYLFKEEASEELIKAIYKINKGEMFLSSAVTRAALERKDQLCGAGLDHDAEADARRHTRPADDPAPEAALDRRNCPRQRQAGRHRACDSVRRAPGRSHERPV